MAQAEVPLNPSGFGETARRDAWWVQPLLVFLGLSRLRRLRHLGRVPGRALPLRARTSRRSTRRSSSATRRTPGSGRSRPGGRRWLPFSPALLILWAPGRLPPHLLLLPRRLLQGVLGRPARPAPSASRARATGASTRFPLILQNVHRYFLYLALLFLVVPGLRRVEGALVRGPGDGQASLRHRRRHAGAGRQRRSCSAATRSAATRCATSSAAASTSSRKSPLCQTALRAA